LKCLHFRGLRRKAQLAWLGLGIEHNPGLFQNPGFTEASNPPSPPVSQRKSAFQGAFSLPPGIVSTLAQGGQRAMVGVMCQGANDLAQGSINLLG
jgi:hypothetical protein